MRASARERGSASVSVVRTPPEIKRTALASINCDALRITARKNALLRRRIESV
jgi:hypothetical protein